MKIKRHQKIVEIINEYPIETQDDLLFKLKETGMDVTQATISRDIKELNLIKSRNDNGVYCYTHHELKVDGFTGEKHIQILKSSLKSVNFALNTVVVKCYTGMAQAACSSIDSLDWDGNIIGTLAGDDTIFIITKTEKEAKIVNCDIENLIK